MLTVKQTLLKCFCVATVAFSVGFSMPARAAAAPIELVVSGAASLTDAFAEMGRDFEKTRPDVRVVTNFAASRVLLQQIEQGAPADVLATADQETMDEAASKKLIDTQSRRNFANNALVLCTPFRGDALKEASELGNDTLDHVAIGNPETVPAGRYAKQYLEAVGLWQTLQPKLILGNNVRQVLDWLVRGEVDAGFVFGTDARTAKDRVIVVEEVGHHSPIAYPIAAVAESTSPQAAAAFIEYVLSEAGQDILKKYGFR